MKRLLTATAALFLTGGLLAATAAELPAPVKTKLEAAQASLAKAKAGTYDHAKFTALCAALSAYPETFGEFVEIATETYNKTGQAYCPADIFYTEGINKRSGNALCTAAVSHKFTEHSTETYDNGKTSECASKTFGDGRNDIINRKTESKAHKYSNENQREETV